MMQPLKLLFVLLLSSASVRAFWWSTSQTSDPPVASKQVQYVRAFTYQPVAFPAHSLLAPPSPYKFIQASPASLLPTGKQITPIQSPSQPVQPVQQQPQQQSNSSPFSSFFGNAFGGSGILPSSAGFYGQQHPSKYPYFTMDQVQYLSSLPSNAPHTPQVQFVPCMCPIAVNVQSHGEVADKRLDETATTDAEVVVPSGESEK
uniref:VM domain-containing protein n=1 Tax=Anopheles minimus TaxID=112268 RepID=A0A182VXI5_9DIPT